MGNWLKIEDFCELTNLKRELVEKLIEEEKITHKEEEGQIFIEAIKSTNVVIKKDVGVAVTDAHASIAFAEKTIGTILNLHEKVLEAKDESIVTLKDENKFLRDALYSIQELYDDDQKNAKFLREQLVRMQEELDTMKRKYKLMWGRAGAGTTELSPLIKDNATSEEQDKNEN